MWARPLQGKLIGTVSFAKHVQAAPVQSRRSLCSFVQNVLFCYRPDVRQFSLNKLFRCLILMDILLLVMDGCRALQTLRADDTLRHLPVIALTASAMKGSREEILAYGFDRYVSKPIEADMLEKTIQEMLYGD